MAENAGNVRGPVRVDRYLSNFSVNYASGVDTAIALAATTVIPVVNKSDMYQELKRGSFLRDDAAPRPLGGRPRQVGYDVTDHTYSATEYALEHVIDDRQRANTNSPLNLDEAGTRLLTDKHLIRMDRVWCQKFFVPGVWANEVVGTSGAGVEGSSVTQWDSDDANPIGDIDFYASFMRRMTGKRPNTLVLGEAVKRKLRTNPDIVDRIKYTQTGVVTDQLIASLFNVDRVVAAESVYNAAMETTPETQVDDFEFIANPGCALLTYVEPTAALNSVTAMATFAWTGLLPGIAQATGQVIERGRDDRAHSDWLQARSAWDMRKVADDLAIFFVNLVPGHELSV
jgi:hypothetical protein